MKFPALLVIFQLFQLGISAQFSFPANFSSLLAIGQEGASKPVTNFSLFLREDKKAILRWQASLGNDAFFSIERSNNGLDYEVIGVIKSAVPASSFLEFSDDAPPRGKIYYRLKCVSEKKVFFSEPVSTIILADISCRFYPNPVDKLLIVRSDLPVDIQINDEWGKSFILTHLEAGLRVLDLTALPSGIYVITLQQRENNKVVTERLVKK
jgi:hypothetical protein